METASSLWRVLTLQGFTSTIHADIYWLFQSLCRTLMGYSKRTHNWPQGSHHVGEGLGSKKFHYHVVSAIKQGAMLFARVGRRACTNGSIYIRFTQKTLIRELQGEEQKQQKLEAKDGHRVPTLSLDTEHSFASQSVCHHSHRWQIWELEETKRKVCMTTVSSLYLPREVFCLYEMSAIKANGHIFSILASSIFYYGNLSMFISGHFQNRNAGRTNKNQRQ